MLARWIYAIALSTLFAACGGGGTDTSSGENAAPSTIESPSSGSGEEGQGGGGSSGGGRTPGEDATPPGSGESPGDNGETPVGESFVYDETARFDRPTDLAIDAAGNLYVMDNGNQAVRRIATNGEVSTLPSINRPGQIAVDPSGNVFLLSYNPVEDEEYRDGMEIHRLTPDAAPVLIRRSQIKPGSSDAYRIATDSKGNVYVLSRYRTIFTVERIDSAGMSHPAYEYFTQTALVGDFASNAEGDLALGVHDDVEPAPDNTAVYVDRLIIVPHSQQPTEGMPEGVTTRPLERSTFGNMVFETNGDIYIADPIASDGNITALRVSRIAADGTTTTLYEGFPDGSTTPRPITDTYRGKVSLARALNGDFYLSDPYLHAVYRITPSGQVSLVAGKPGEAGSAD